MRARFLAALLLIGAAAAGAAPAPKVALRIAPEVDSQFPQLRSQIAAGGVAEVAEPADLLLTTGDELDDYAELDPVDGSNFNIVRLGKFANGEAQSALPGVLALLQRQKALIALAGKSKAVGIEACVEDGSRHTKCDPAVSYAPTTIRNLSGATKYVAIVTTSANLGMNVAELRDQESVVRLGPGQQLLAPASNVGAEGTSHQIVLVSGRPFDAAPFAQQISLGSTPSCFVRLYPECVAIAAPFPSTDGIQAIESSYDDRNRAWDDDKSPPPAMGGGYRVGRGDADWMVELYSTLPYTAAEIKADKNLPPAEQKHLAERSPAELAHACGGTMIGRDLVLTAAHCVATGRFLPPNESRVFTDRRVRLGSLRLGEGGETRAIIGMVVHQGYTGQGNRLVDDIALLLLKTDEPVRLGIPSLKIGSATPKPGSDLVGLGWGYTQAVAPGANVLMSIGGQLQHNPHDLQVAPLEVLPSPDCNKRVQGQLGPGMVCLVTPKAVLASGGAPTFSCRGDSGGPLVQNYRSSAEELVGMTSWSLGCGYRDTPSVYTDAAYFSRWVDAARKAIRPGSVIRIGDPPLNH